MGEPARDLDLTEPEHTAEPPRRSTMRELLARELANADVDGFVQAAHKYGDDHERELADLLAGQHPLQRHDPGR